MPDRVQIATVEGGAALFTAEFTDYLLRLHDALDARGRALREKRAERLAQALEHGRQPGPLPASAATTGDWKVPPVPKDLATPGIEKIGRAHV